MAPENQAHTIKRYLVTGNSTGVFRIKCSCGFHVDSPRLATAARRKQLRLIAEHLDHASATQQPQAAAQ